jgi:hypothetical protein
LGDRGSMMHGRRASTWTSTTGPRWTIRLLERDPITTAEIAVWRAALGIEDTYTEPSGPTRILASEARQRGVLTDRINTSVDKNSP